MDERFGYEHAARQLHLSVRQVKRLKSAGALHCETQGRRVWFTRQNLVDYLDTLDTRRPGS